MAPLVPVLSVCYLRELTVGVKTIDKTAGKHGGYVVDVASGCSASNKNFRRRTTPYLAKILVGPGKSRSIMRCVRGWVPMWCMKLQKTQPARLALLSRSTVWNSLTITPFELFYQFCVHHFIHRLNEQFVFKLQPTVPCERLQCVRYSENNRRHDFTTPTNQDGETDTIT